jgi:hypothetical protein
MRPACGPKDLQADIPDEIVKKYQAAKLAATPNNKIGKPSAGWLCSP